MLSGNKQMKGHMFSKINSKVIYLDLSLQNVWGNVSVMAVGQQTLKY